VEHLEFCFSGDLLQGARRIDADGSQAAGQDVLVCVLDLFDFCFDFFLVFHIQIANKALQETPGLRLTNIGRPQPGVLELFVLSLDDCSF